MSGFLCMILFICFIEKFSVCFVVMFLSVKMLTDSFVFDRNVVGVVVVNYCNNLFFCLFFFVCIVDVFIYLLFFLLFLFFFVCIVSVLFIVMFRVVRFVSFRSFVAFTFLFCFVV